MVETLEQPALIVPARAPRLTQLEAHGFKSFANRTAFRFEPGITAVVGPNGSGKSNVADAVRWVLGEQGSGALRARRSDDVIFAGGQGRAPASMAEAALTFDNADGWLPIDFAEVTITRRAFRGGENHYLINGKRVRLKDVAQLTAGLGHSHVVVGQGLVDAALSQRPEERRALFEHAADLSGLRLRVAEASRNLAETEANSARVADLLAELEPRLAALRRAARQAAEYRDARAELQALQRGHLAGLLRAAVAGLDAARERETEAERAAAAANAAVRQAIQAGTDARAEAETARAALDAHEAARRDLDERRRRRRHERDLARERAAALDRRRQDMADTQSGLDEQAAAVAADLYVLAGDLAALGAEMAATKERAAELAAAATAARAERTRLERAAGDRDRRRAAIERDRAAVAQRSAVLTQKREGGAAERDRLRAAGAERAERIAALEAEVAAADAAAGDEAARLARLDQTLADLAEAERRAAADLAAAANGAADAERALHEATARLSALRRLHESGAGLYAGVRATLQAGAAGTLHGVLGTVAELIAAPAELDTAIEVALGGHLQDVVVRRWRDAEAAIAHLKRSGAGRATFQPLDTVTASRRTLPERALAAPGVRGVAADLVRSEPELRTVVDALLGRTLVVADLPAARAALPLLPGGWSAVTLGGEIARSGGSVTGGAAVRESGILGRERELRELPTQVESLRAALDRAREARTAAETSGGRLAAERLAAEAQRAAAVAAGEERARQRGRLASWLADLRREADAAAARLEALDADAVAITAELADLDERERALAADLAGLGEEHRTHEADIERAAAALREAETATADAGRTVAALEERLRAERRREAGLRTRAEAIATEAALRAERAEALDRERASFASEAARLETDAAALDAEASEMEEGRAPLHEAARAAETASARLERTLEANRAALLERERAHGAATIARERAEAEAAAVARRARDDLDLEDPAALLDDPDPLDTSDAAAVEQREREIARRKERLRRIGYVGEEAVAEYEREAERHAFLRAQLDDIAGAAAALRSLLADLDATMRARFEATFAQVAAAFSDLFTTLFGGGSAELTLSRGEDGEPAIDVAAQPPGKRLQNLALLSGGERALTGVALLFAILRVNPAPFCLLDEMDAALDEANVVRVREQLRALAEQTQTIVITHNRGTIEIADTLYGVSMGADGVSKVLSLRLADPA